MTGAVSLLNAIFEPYKLIVNSKTADVDIPGLCPYSESDRDINARWGNGFSRGCGLCRGASPDSNGSHVWSLFLFSCLGH